MVIDWYVRYYLFKEQRITDMDAEKLFGYFSGLANTPSLFPLTMPASMTAMVLCQDTVFKLMHWSLFIPKYKKHR